MVLREALVVDAASITHVHVESWRGTYRGIVPDVFLDGLRVNERTAWWERLLGDGSGGQFAYVAADAGDQIVGFASGGPLRSAITGYAGELYALYLLHSHQRLGIGRSLVHSWPY